MKLQSTRSWLCNLLAVLTLCLPPQDSPRAAPALLVHVNQVALERTGPKSAVVEYTGSRNAGRFAVLKDGTAVQSGELVAVPKFSEWGAGRKYFKADFSSLAINGTYQLQITLGEDTAKSAAFVVADNATFVTTASAILDYYKANRHTNEADRKIRVFDSQRYVDVWGGWKDAGGDNGKYLSHLSYANFFNPQQTSLVVWALAESYDSAPDLYRRAGLDTRVVEEALWGADFLHRLLSDEGYFYMTVFDRWSGPGERMVTGYVGQDGVYTKDYQAAFREGAGVAIAALARASMLSKATGIRGEFSADRYLQDAEKAFAHLQTHNREYCDDSTENIIDDYTALLAAIELHRATGKDTYLDAARQRANNLSQRLTSGGWFRSDSGTRPYYHAAEAGFPIVSLVHYLRIERDPNRVQQARTTISKALDHQLALTDKVSNPFNYARQNFRSYRNGKLGAQLQEGFFIPHANETGYWWQGESARLASLATAAILGGRALGGASSGPSFGVNPKLAEFAQSQLDWTLGRNPFDMCLLYGFGVNNPPHAESAGDMVKGGISNGITGATASDDGRGIVFAPGPDENNWRWIEQWLPHSTWFLLAATAMADTAPKDAVSSTPPAPILFDDFSHKSFESFNQGGWIVRSAVGWPGIEGATWNDAIAFIDDEQQSGNRLVRMTAKTDGRATRQAQFCHQRKYLEGTYAARVRFSDKPVSGPDGDQIVQTFYNIAPIKKPLDLDYSEQDFEYLPNGGWGGTDLALHTTTWETFRLEPWEQVSASGSQRGSLEGWHTLVMQVQKPEVRYFLDGKLIANHGEPYFPEEHMSINFNLWFIRQGLIDSRQERVYQEDVDWVFHAAGRSLSPAAVEQQVKELRAAGVSFRDTVPATNPVLASPCDF
jgi:hypothetical protein